MFVIQWPDNPQLGHTSLEVRSKQGHYAQNWPPMRLRLLKNPFATFREVPFDEICPNMQMIGAEPKES